MVIDIVTIVLEFVGGLSIISLVLDFVLFAFLLSSTGLIMVNYQQAGHPILGIGNINTDPSIN